MAHWSWEEILICSNVYASKYNQSKFKHDSKGKFNPTKATGLMSDFYTGVSKALKAYDTDRTSNAINKKN